MKILPVVFLVLACHGVLSAQENKWKELRPLESTREEVERVIGKPAKYFETSGLYKDKPYAVFSAWYSDDQRCRSKKLGRHYNVRRGILTALYFSLTTQHTLSDFEADVAKFNRLKFDEIPDVVYYYSPEESLVYKTYVDKDGKEYVLSVSLEPGKGKVGLLCKKEI
jgi:hypothetical protein